jgi:hypothetical protein
MKFKISPGILGRYKNLNYQPWYAISEFVDNSLHSFLLNKIHLESVGVTKLEVSISYDANEEVLMVVDNSSGMNSEDLERSLEIGRTKERADTQLSEFGMGMKTSAIWLGNLLTIRTKHFSSSEELYVEVDIDKIMNEDFELSVQSRQSTSTKPCYTIIEVRRHNRKFQGRTLGVIRETLKSIYSKFITDGILELRFGDQVLTPDLFTPLITRNGIEKKKTIEFTVNGKSVSGFVGILSKGSGKKSGFSIYRNKRLIRGYPENNFRPREIFSQEGGTNTLINQRVYGELIMDDFDVTHTKDDISFNGNEEEIFRSELAKQCVEIVNVASQQLSSISEGKFDIKSPEAQLIGQDVRESLNGVEYQEAFENMKFEVEAGSTVLEQYVQASTDDNEKLLFETEIFVSNGSDKVSLKIYLNSEEQFAPYLVIDKDFDRNIISVIVNTEHVYVRKVIHKSDSFREFLMQCAFDALAEDRVSNQVDRLIQPSEFRLAKDKFLKVYSSN